MSSAHTLDSLDAVREIIGEPSPTMPMKLHDSLDEMSMAFIRCSPMFLLATAGSEGLPEVSPKGDEPGFVVGGGSHHPVRPGTQGQPADLQPAEHPRQPAGGDDLPGPWHRGDAAGAGACGTHGRSADVRPVHCAGPACSAGHAGEGRALLLPLRQGVQALAAVGPDSWPPRQGVSFGKQAKDRHGLDDETAEQIDASVEEDYRTNL
jgi:uncharacterized protein